VGKFAQLAFIKPGKLSTMGFEPMAKFPPEVAKYFEKQGRLGGKTAAENMTEEERLERARKAGQASGKARSSKKAAKKKAAKKKASKRG
jgi:hypothetical protein